MPRSKEQFEKMRVNSKNMILEAALKLFTIKGYHSTSINDIAKEAGVAVGLMYNYFSSKEDLLLNIIDENLKQLFTSIAASGIDHNNVADVRKVIDSIISAIVRQNYSWKLIIATSFLPDVSESVKNRMNKLHSHQVDMFKNYFLTRSVKDPEESAKVLGEVLHAAFLKYACSENLDELMLIRRTVVEKLLEENPII